MSVRQRPCATMYFTRSYLLTSTIRTMPEDFAESKWVHSQRRVLVSTAQSEEPFNIPFIYLRLPLYKQIRVILSQLNELKGFTGPLDAYCPECKLMSVFTYAWARGGGAGMSQPESSRRMLDHRFRVELACSRNTSHTIALWFDVRDHHLTKIGQFPSLADLLSEDFVKYRSILTQEQLAGLKRGVGLTAHGVGAGSLVYLRRLFEELLEEARTQAEGTQAWDEQKYQRSKVPDRINLLKEHLPRFIVEHRSVYGLLSKGIHELSEAECLEMFPVVQGAIELILDERMEHAERQRKHGRIANALNQLSSQIGRKSAS